MSRKLPPEVEFVLRDPDARIEGEKELVGKLVWTYATLPVDQFVWTDPPSNTGSSKT